MPWLPPRWQHAKLVVADVKYPQGARWCRVPVPRDGAPAGVVRTWMETNAMPQDRGPQRATLHRLGWDGGAGLMFRDDEMIPPLTYAVFEHYTIDPGPQPAERAALSCGFSPNHLVSPSSAYGTET